AVPALIDILNDFEPKLRGYACVALRRIGAPAVPLLIEALRFDAEEYRRRFDRSSPSRPAECWAQDEALFRSSVATALLFIGPDAAEAMEHLRPWLSSDDRRLRLAAHMALTVFG